ncbi:uncharacterized protein BDV14DRAFT_190918 [Aspergillus stella-maris]|uniref:uncharacterized protein n=1 Tax=Aspergillus stella-maris TaxID=1810926 RepID=UPI003CCDB8A2
MDQPRPPRSCTLCRQRKIKCDRQQPCGNCIRLESTCIYPAGFGRAPKRPRKGVEARLLAQLSRLESAVKRMEGQSGAPTPDPTNTATATNANTNDNHNESSNDNETNDPNGSIDSQIGRLVIDENQSCYVSSAPWAQLGDEIEEMRDLLHHPLSDDENDDHDHGSVSASTDGPGSGSSSGVGAGANGALLGYRALAHSLATYHPPLSQAVLLFDIFKANVGPLVRIFHTPSLDRLFWDAIASMDALNKNIEALLFAIYYAAVISLEGQECLSMFGTSRASLLETYRFATEQATARADLLNTQNFILLQATVVFLTALRNEDNSRTVWSLIALVYHIAQAMGLHRDGEAFGLRPLETELRRRLWWHICLLDNRSTDYHGAEPIVHEHIFDTKMPLHINDADITVDMTVPPMERKEATEMTLCLIRCHSMRVIWKVGYMAPHELRNANANTPDLAEKQRLVEELEGGLQEKYLRHCNPNQSFGRLALMVARVITRRIWMTILCSRCQMDSGARNRLFNDSVEVLQYSKSLLTDKDIRQWAWHSKTHIQWYCVAILLAELCRRPPSPECDEAWECVNAIYERWISMEAEKGGTLWRPIRRLMARTRYVREVQWERANATAKTNTNGTGTGTSWNGSTTAGTPRQPGIGALANTCVFAGVDGFALPTGPQGHRSVTEYDPLLEMPPLNAPSFLDASVMDLFGFFSEAPAPQGTPRYVPDMNILPP